MRARDHGRAYGRILALGAALAVICSAATGTAGAQPSTQQQQPPVPPQQPQRVLKIVVVGDSYSAGEGIHPTGKASEESSYIDAQDPRHQSTLSAAAQGAARLQEANPGVQVELHVAASSGAATPDVFKTQRKDPLSGTPGNRPQDGADMRTWYDTNDMAVNIPQIEQIPLDADVVIMGLGGNDAFFGPLVEAYARDFAVKAGQLRDKANKLLDTKQPDEVYREQAKGAPGMAPTLVARLLQVLQAVKDRAPNAKLVLQTYPVAVDPEQWSARDMLRQRDMVAMKEFAKQLNDAIKHAAKLCGCASVADVSEALKGRELNTSDPGINSVLHGLWGDKNNWSHNEPVHPNRKGASLMADHIAKTLASELGLTMPEPQKDRQTDTSKIKITHTPAPDTDNDGTADYKDNDWDGDDVPNTKDRRPNKPGTADEIPERGAAPPAVTVPPRVFPQSAPQQPKPAPLKPINQQGPESRPRPVPINDTGTPLVPPRQDPQPPRQDTDTGTQPPPNAPQPPPRPNPPTQPPTQPQPPKPQPPKPQPPKPPEAPPAPKPQPPTGSGQKPKGPVIPPSTATRSTKMPSIPKPPAAPKFNPAPGASQLGGGPLGVNRPPLPTVPGLTPRPGSKTPLGGSKPPGATPPLPTKAPTPPPQPKPTPRPAPPVSSPPLTS